MLYEIEASRWQGDLWNDNDIELLSRVLDHEADYTPTKFAGGLPTRKPVLKNSCLLFLARSTIVLAS